MTLTTTNWQPVDDARQLVQEVRSVGDHVDTVILGSLIFVKGDAAWIAPHPELRKGEGQTRNEPYWKKAYCVSYADLIKGTASTQLPRVVLTTEQLPELWRIDEAFFHDTDALPLGCQFTSTQLKTWATKRDVSYAQIAALVEGRSLEELLYDNELTRRTSEHALDIGANRTKLLSLVNRYIHAGGHKRGCFPRAFLCGGRGKPKIPGTPSGRPNRAFQRGDSAIRGFVCQEFDRINCQLGWKLFKNPNTTTDAAYAKFLNKFYAASARHVGSGRIEVELLPLGQYPTKEQFQYFGQMNDPMRSSSLMNVSHRARRNNIDGHGGTARSHYTLALQAGIVDSTSDDQGALCSMASPLLMLQSTWTTRIVCATTDYIFGEYTSFEAVSARTHMAAIVHAATPKVEWANSIGYHLKEGEWHHGEFKSICGDNGEGKCLEVIDGLSNAGIEAMFTPSYLSRARTLVERAHLMAHGLVDWRSKGSTLGRMRNRMEKLDTDSPYDYIALLHRKIQGVLHINNVERVEHLLTIEMRRHGVEPTRRAIFEYMRETGQVADGPGNLLALLPSTLPHLEAQVQKEGIRIWDPRWPAGRALIPDLNYWSPWLADEGILTRARQQKMRVMVAIDPMYLGRIYIGTESGWREVELQTSDEEKSRLTLLDWVEITDLDATKRYFAGHTINQSKATMAATTASIEKAGADRKKHWLESGALPPRGTTKRGRTSDELWRINQQRLGFDGTEPQISAAPSVEEARPAGLSSLTPSSVRPDGSLVVLPDWMVND